MNINYYLEDIYEQIRWGDLTFNKRVGNSFYFMDETKEVCYNVNMESISVAEFTKTGKDWTIYIDRNNLAEGITNCDEYIFNSIFELILEIVMSNVELKRLDDNLNDIVLNEEFEKASKLRDIIKNIKLILNKL